MNVDNVDVLIVSGEGAAEASALGLSNKGVHNTNNNNNENVDANVELLQEELSKANLDVKHGGTIVEEYLATNTLWPETSKLYGHGDDVFSVAAHPSGKLLASGAKGTKESTAEILLWEHNETHNDWRMVESLLGPTLTAVALEFSNDGGTLIVASRDRHACVFTRISDDSKDLSEGWLLTNRFKAHAREMYDLAFLNDSLFITVGRDKKVNVWQINASSSSSSSEEEMKPSWSSDSACSSAPTCVSVLNDVTFATGHENGSIKIWTRKGKDDNDDEDSVKWSVAGDIPNAHRAEVTKVAFKPSSSEIVLATCGADHVTRVYRITEL
jgi:elongator complex protein 2